MDILRKSHLKDVPWKNGGGITRHIAEATYNSQTAWRLSRADVDTQGPFSNFEGLTRILTIVSQHRMLLRHQTGVIQAQPWAPVTFDGGLAVTSELPDGPLTDFNLMFDPSLCSASVTTLRGPHTLTLTPKKGGLIALHGLSGQATLAEHTVETGDTALLDAASPLALEGEAAVLKIDICYTDQSKLITSRMASR